ncbi:hypothetical protein FUSO4_03085, partial [Fusobacterium necrophorum DJ-1]
TMANYVLTLPLKTEKWQEDILDKRLNIARLLYNASLNEILKRYRKMQNDVEYKHMKHLDPKEQSKKYKEIKQDLGFLKKRIVYLG